MRYLFCLVGIVSTMTCFGQTISKFLVNDYKINDTTIAEIIETKTYFEPSKTSTYEKTYYYNNKGFLILRVGSDTEGKLSSRISYNYNERGDLILLKEEFWNQAIGYSATTTKFIFDSLELKAIQVLGTNGELQSSSQVRFENSKPISIHSYDKNSILIGYEIAKYDLTKNKVIITVFNNLGNQFGNPIELNINLSNRKDFKLEGAVYNNFGEIIQEIKHKCYSCDELVTYEYEFKYDKHNNWTKKVTYLKVGSGSNKTEITNRKIKYIKYAT